MIETYENLNIFKEKYDLITENINDLVSIINQEYKIEYFNNKPLIKTLGHESADLFGKSWLNYVHPDDLELTINKLNDCKLYGQVSQELRLRHKNGSFKRFKLQVKEFVGRNEIKKLLLILRDMTEIGEFGQIEQKLKESENKLQGILSSITDQISIIDKHFNIVYANENVKVLYGSSIEGAICYKIFHNRNDVCEDCQVAKTFTDGNVHHKECERLRKKGDIIFSWCTSSVAARDEKGQPTLVVEVSRDITEQKKAEEKIKHQAMLVESVSDAIISTDLDFNIISWNKAAELIYGWKAEEVIGKNILDTITVEYPNDDQEAVLKQFFEEGFWKGEVIQPRKDGTPINILTSISMIKDITGKPIGAVAINRDITDRKKAEEKIRESEVKFRSLYEASIDGIVRTNMEGKILECNQAYLDMIGYTMEEIIELTYQQITPKKWHEMEEGIVKNQFIARGYSDEYEKEYIKKDGAIFPVALKGWLLRDTNGNPKEMHGYLRDITLRKKAEQKLKDSERKYKNLANELEMILDHIPGIVVYKDTENNMIRVNKFLAEAHNITKEEMEGKNAFDFYPKDQAQAYWEDDLEVVNSRQPKLNIVEPWEPEKGKRWVSTSKIPYIDEDGNVKGIIAIANDITELKIAEQKLRESEEKFRTIAEQSLLGLTIVQDGLVIFTNQAFSNILEYSVEEINRWSSKDTLKVIYKEDLPQVLEQLKTRKKDDLSSILQYQCRILTKSRKLKWVEVISKPIFYQGRTAIILSLIDITANKKAEEELKEISRLKSEFLRRTSHELKTPLVSIKGYTDFLLNVQSDEFDLQTISILDEIKSGCDRFESLIKDILDTSQLESDTVELNKLLEDLSFLIRFCYKDLKGLIKVRNHKIFIDIQDRMYIMFEKERIYDVIINLLSNAINYTPPNGKIKIKSEINDNYYIISIKDNGIGLTEEEKSKLFKKFGKIERYGQGLDVVSEGSGIGLYISKKIVELHGGKIWVESEGRNKGSTFYFSLPIIKS